MSVLLDRLAKEAPDGTPVEEPVEAGDIIVSYLRQLGVDYVFGVPGGALEPLFNALGRSRRQQAVRPVVARHESGAAFMADGYARETGRLGVCCATTGPGATNLITGVASAYQDHVPMLVITAQTPLRTFGRGAVQESSCTAINTVEMLARCTRYSTLVSHPEQLEVKLAAAIMTALRHPRGPVHLSIPLDLMRTRMRASRPAYDLRTCVTPRQTVDLTAFTELESQLDCSGKIALLVGSGAGAATPNLIRFSEQKDARIVTTPQGKGLVDPHHPLYMGVFGLAGHEGAYHALVDASVDLVLAVGTALDEQASRCWDEKALLNRRLIHVDAVAENFTRSPMARLHVHGDPETVFSLLLERSRHGDTPVLFQPDAGRVDRGRSVRGLPAQLTLADPDKCFDTATPIKPQRLIYELSSRLPDTTRYLADIGNSFLWALHYLNPGGEGLSPDKMPAAGFLRTSMGFASMGWAIGGAVGTAVGSRGVPVVCITGDGSFLMNGQEISVAVQEHLPVIFVVLNDQALGTVKHGQRLAGAERIGFELPDVDFAQMARAMGAQAFTVDSPGDLASLDFEAICSRPGPTLLDVHVDPEEVPPLRMRMESLGTGCGR